MHDADVMHAADVIHQELKRMSCVQILRAIGDGMDCRGYYIWTLVDK